MVPKRAPCGPDVVGPAPHQALGLVGAGVGGQVDVGARLGPGGEQRVAHGAAHQVERPPGAREAARQLLGGARLGGGTARAPTWTAPAHGSAASSLSLCRRAGPGPPSARSPWPPQPSSERRARAPRVPRTRPATDAPPLALASQTPWVTPDRALVQRRLRRRRGRRRPASGLHVSLTFYCRLDDASQLQQAIAGTPPTGDAAAAGATSPSARRGGGLTASACVTVLPDAGATRARRRGRAPARPAAPR